VSRKLDKGEIPVKRVGDFITYSVDLSEDERSVLEDNAAAVAEDGTFLEGAARSDSMTKQSELHELLLELQRRGVNEMNWPYLRPLDYPGADHFGNRWSEKTFGTMLAEVWEDALNCYQRLLETQFAELKQATELGDWLPRRVFIKFSQAGYYPSTRIAVVEEEALESSVASVVDELIYERPHRLVVDGVPYEKFSYRLTEYPSPSADSATLLHDLVYSFLRDDLLDAWDEIELE
jgi:hypothetical protein